MRAVGYVRVSTGKQAQSGLGLDAQRRGLVAEAEHRGWELTLFEDAGFTGRNDKRPGLQRALRLLRRREADVLMVFKLDRISRSTQDFSKMLATAKRQHWSLVALDLGVDTTTANGRLVANILMSIAEWESEAIGARTSAAMQAAKSRDGVQYGRPSAIDSDPSLSRRITDLHAQGLSATAIGREVGKHHSQVLGFLRRSGLVTA